MRVPLADVVKTDGAAYLAKACLGLASSGYWQDERESNPLGGEAPEYPRNQARGNSFEVDDIAQPGPDPRFGHDSGSAKFGPSEIGAQTEETLARRGFSVDEIDVLLRDDTIRRR